MGQGALHAVWHPAVRLRHPAVGGRLHLGGADLLPPVGRGLQVVVAQRAEHRLHRPLHLRLLSLLLPEPLVHERRRAEHRVLWLLASDGACVLADAGQRVVLGLAGVHPLHLPQPEDGLKQAELYYKLKENVGENGQKKGNFGGSYKI